MCACISCLASLVAGFLTWRCMLRYRNALHPGSESFRPRAEHTIRQFRITRTQLIIYSCSRSCGGDGCKVQRMDALLWQASDFSRASGSSRGFHCIALHLFPDLPRPSTQSAANSSLIAISYFALVFFDAFYVRHPSITRGILYSHRGL